MLRRGIDDGICADFHKRRLESVLRHFSRYQPDELCISAILIGANDLLIAAHACAMGLTLITNNVREFERVENLKIENWAEEP